MFPDAVAEHDKVTAVVSSMTELGVAVTVGLSKSKSKKATKTLLSLSLLSRYYNRWHNDYGTE